MKILGIQFAPFNIPIERRIQTFLTGAAVQFMTLGPLSGCGIILLGFLSGYWLVPLLYLAWIWIVDKNISSRGGRRVEWIRGWIWWKYLRDYFPINIKVENDVALHPKKNYLFCSFPHGLLATGVFTALGTTACGFQKEFPNHKPHLLTLKQNFNVPLYRDFLLSVGMCSASAKSINWLMRDPEGGNVAVLVVGGAAESFCCRPGHYELVLKNRKGFVRLALKNGSALVPVFSFGETDIYDQVDNPEGSLLRRFQEFMKKTTGVAPIIPLGRGYFQYSFGVLPRRKPITVIIGKPLEVEKIEEPTQDQIDEVHEKFMKSLSEIFEKHKHEYVEKPENTMLTFI